MAPHAGLLVANDRNAAFVSETRICNTSLKATATYDSETGIFTLERNVARTV